MSVKQLNSVHQTFNSPWRQTAVFRPWMFTGDLMAHCVTSFVNSTPTWTSTSAVAHTTTLLANNLITKVQNSVTERVFTVSCSCTWTHLGRIYTDCLTSMLSSHNIKSFGLPPREDRQLPLACKGWLRPENCLGVYGIYFKGHEVYNVQIIHSD